MIGLFLWLTRALAWLGAGGILSDIGRQIETNTFIGNQSVSLIGGIFLIIFAIGSFGWVGLTLEDMRA